MWHAGAKIEAERGAGSCGAMASTGRETKRSERFVSRNLLTIVRG